MKNQAVFRKIVLLNNFLGEKLCNIANLFLIEGQVYAVRVIQKVIYIFEKVWYNNDIRETR